MRILHAITVLLSASIFATPALSSSFPGGTGAGMTSSSARYPNIIFLMIDDIGREQYPQLDSPYKDNGTASFSGMNRGNFYPVPSASDFPHLTNLLDNGINFTGVWSGNWCTATRHMLHSGARDGGAPNSPDTPGALTPVGFIQTLTNDRYLIEAFGKCALGVPGILSGELSNCSPGAGGQGFAWNEHLPNPVTDGDLFTSGGVQVMLDDESRSIHKRQSVEAVYSNAAPSESTWFENETGRPFLFMFSYEAAHAGGGTDCFHKRTPVNKPYAINGYVVPVDESQALWASGLPASSPLLSHGPTRTYGPATNPTYDEVASLVPPNAAEDWYKIWYDCTVTQLMWVDEQIGELVAWLGPSGMENTLIILTGDNGTSGEQVTMRQGLRPPTTTVGGSPPLDDLIHSSNAGVAGVGKNSMSETGLNVAFVAGYGPIPQELRGTTSEARLDFRDVAETIVQLVLPDSTGTGYYPDGEDFTPLLLDSAAPRHSLLGVKVSHQRSAGLAASLDPAGGVAGAPSYRLLRANGFCDYVQDLNSVTPTANIRSSTDPLVIQAIIDLQAAILADFPTTTENSGNPC